ncbi:hypothetical protein ACQ9BO_07805 [Flavobacterium sp. P21]|uniref:hypothetical protein n=1 Tax=Flavobacterium sp. P21 TaxID=3423948 RepID=UPI003D66DD97
MTGDKIETLEELKHFASYHFKMLRPAESIYDGDILEIKVSGYSDMIRLGVNLIRMCLHIVHSDALDDREMDIGSVMELALQMFPKAELEVLDEIQKLLLVKSENQNEILTQKNE